MAAVHKQDNLRQSTENVLYMPTQWKILTFQISHIYFDPPGISIVILWNCVCVLRGKYTLVAHYCVRASMHRGVNTKPFDTSAGVALMYVTVAACLPFPQPCKAPTFPPARCCFEQPDLPRTRKHTHTHNNPSHH